MPINLPLLTHLYRAELRQRGTEADFRLDTLSATSQPAYRLRAPGTKGPVAVRVLPSRAGYPVHTPPVQLNPVRGPWVGASFRPPTAFVLRRMAGGLAGSVALLGLTTGSLILAKMRQPFSLSKTGFRWPASCRAASKRAASLCTTRRMASRVGCFSNVSGPTCFAGYMHRQGGPGSTASDFDLNLYGGNYEYDFEFHTQNLAPFAETIIRLTDRLSLTPGVRYEGVGSSWLPARRYFTQLPAG